MENYEKMTTEDLILAVNNACSELFEKRNYSPDMVDINTDIKQNGGERVVGINVATRDFNKFNIYDTNRDIVSANVENIKESLTNTNYRMIKNNPVLVDKNYNITNGQHRTKALTDLDMPIVYSRATDIIEDDIKAINTQKNLVLTDWLKHNLKIKAYSDLDNLMKKYDIPNISLAISIFCEPVSTKAFKMGECKLSIKLSDRLDKLEEVSQFFGDVLLDGHRINLNTRQSLKNRFVKVMFELYDLDGFDIHSISNKIEMGKLDLYGVSTDELMRTKLLSVYNKGLYKKNKIRYDD